MISIDKKLMDTFQLNLFKLINKTRAHDNLLFSPISLYIALALCSNGAERNTLTEMLHALSKDCTLDQLNNDCTRIIAKLSSTQSVKVANAVMSTIQKTPEFTAKCKEYKAFDEPLKSVGQVNDWCAKNTNNKITSIIDTIDEYTRLLILNAVYFLGKWKQSFNPILTREVAFTNSLQQKMKCNMMHHGGSIYPYKEYSDCQVLQLDYSENTIKAIIILPSVPISTFIDSLTNEKLLKYTSQLKETAVIFGMPRFEISTGEILNEHLKKTGIRQAFSGEAQFTPMFTSKEQVYIGTVLQKSFIKVDENGTEAASVTCVQLSSKGCGGGSEELPKMICDSPFLFLIKQSDITDHFLFITKIENTLKE